MVTPAAGQEVAVDGPVYDLDQIPVFSNGNAINDIHYRAPCAQLSDVQKIAPYWKNFVFPPGS